MNSLVMWFFIGWAVMFLVVVGLLVAFDAYIVVSREQVREQQK